MWKKQLSSKRCKPPYFPTPKPFPICRTKETIKESQFHYGAIKEIDYPKACKRISKLRVIPQVVSAKELNREPKEWSLRLALIYTCM